MVSKRDIYAEVRDKILDQLEQGVVPWRRPWTRAEFPVNLKSESPYRGINIFLLGMAGQKADYDSPYWVTFNQAMEMCGYESNKTTGKWGWHYKWTRGNQFVAKVGEEDGKPIRGEDFYTIKSVGKNAAGEIKWVEDTDGKVWLIDEVVDPKYGVRKGEKGTSIIFWKPIESIAKDEAGRPVIENGVPVMRRAFILRCYSVFNVGQCHLPDHVLEKTIIDPMEPIDHDQIADDTVKAYLGDLGGPTMKHAGDRACYSPKQDMVTVPLMDKFHSTGGYYSTVFHELVHSTGHESRLKRFEPASFGSDPYAREELVAEMGASMMVGVCGLTHEDEIQNAAAYIHNWMQRIKDDATLLVTAAAQAQRASDHIQGIIFGEDD